MISLPLCFVFSKDNDHQGRKMFLRGFKFETGEGMLKQHLTALNKFKAAHISKSHLRVGKDLKTGLWNHSQLWTDENNLRGKNRQKLSLFS